MMLISWDYIAGLFDGEGYVSARSTRNGRTSSPLISIGIVNTNREALEAVRDFLGFGHITADVPRPKPNVISRKVCFTLSIMDHRNALKFLQGVSKRTIIKREKVRDAIDVIISHTWQGTWVIEAGGRMGLTNEYWKKGMTLVQIAKRAGVRPYSVWLAMRRLNIPLRPLYRDHPKIPASDVERIRNFVHAKGHSVRTIAKLYDVNSSSVVRYMLRHDIQPRNTPWSKSR